MRRKCIQQNSTVSTTSDLVLRGLMGELSVCCSPQQFVNLSICPTPLLLGRAKCNEVHHLPNTPTQIPNTPFQMLNTPSQITDTPFQIPNTPSQVYSIPNTKYISNIHHPKSRVHHLKYKIHVQNTKHTTFVCCFSHSSSCPTKTFHSGGKNL